MHDLRWEHEWIAQNVRAAPNRNVNTKYSTNGAQWLCYNERENKTTNENDSGAAEKTEEATLNVIL